MAMVSPTIERLEDRSLLTFGAVFELSGLTGANGFQISGEAALNLSGISVSATGDINGDGIDDLIIGAYLASPNGAQSGASYVVFGSRAAFGATLNLSALNGSNGFQINGEAAGDFSGRSVSEVGDINGDGIDDLIIGAYRANPNGALSGASYVVFGSRAAFGATLNLSALDGSNGFQISGEAANDLSGISVSAAGDINGDGIDDLIIGAFGASPNGAQSGASYVVFGSRAAFGATLNLSALDGSNGFQISGEAAGDVSGRSVSAVGDINGDGIDDLIIGADGADPNGSVSGASYVVFGQEGTVVLNGDFGDAPSAAQSGGIADYPVTAAENGASHGAIGATLGTDRDMDSDPTHSANADSDDATETDDEDGVTFTASVIRSATVALQSAIVVNLQNPDATSNLFSGWIDFNRDGDWDDDGERILHNVSLGTTAGEETLTYTIPAGSIVGDTFARFRLSSAGNSLPTGAALDGEVEDYRLTIMAASAPAVVDLPTNGTGDIYTSVEGDNIVVRQGGPTGTILLQTPLAEAGPIEINGNDGTDDLHLRESHRRHHRISPRQRSLHDRLHLPGTSHRQHGGGQSHLRLLRRFGADRTARLQWGRRHDDHHLNAG